jgi:tripartite-type tricarboxylate transporter receptor subunit TctC
MPKPILSGLCVALAMGGFAAGLTGPAAAQSPADFYKGKNIDLIIGFTQGGGYDVYARVVGRHMEKHIPGQPKIIPKQMTGAGSRKAAGYVFNVAAQDGTTMATADQSLPLQQALEEPGLQFDANKLLWIGNVNADINTLAMWHTSGITSIEQTKTREIILGATGPNTSAQYPQVMNNLLGTKFKIISGYPGGADINLAMERGEVAGRGSNAWASWKSTKPEWLKEKKINILVQIGLEKAPDLQDVPLLMDLAKNAEDRAVLRLLSAPTAIGRPIFTTPNVPMDRVTALRRAFDATMTDAGFLAEAEKAQLDLNPVAGEKLQEIVEEIIAAPKPVARKLAEALVIRDVVRDLQTENPQPAGSASP